ncbi:MAG: VOC family protein [Coriobacteriales bacterium]|jgi:lactoylglutathione lyase|nr:VOC family protein [Coriobacteriales bacterium]
MKAKMIHTSIHVLDLEKSLKFYEEALGLHELHSVNPEDGSWRLVFLSNDTTDYEFELTWNKGRTEPYDNGAGDIHLAFTVDDIEEAHALHEAMGCIVFENPDVDFYFIADPDGFWLEILPKR